MKQIWQPRRTTPQRGREGRRRPNRLEEVKEAEGTTENVNNVNIVNNHAHNFKYNKGFSCFYTNADSLPNKIEELRLIARNSNPKIIAITETKPKNLARDQTQQ